ncbi:MAG: Dihydrolipoyl dehydrogenase [Spirochaetes bacterium ADurb.Bin315]|nr:MAG: Dihydrolipoyl dehydrogenase [Spirochaetes bacterium ADurb.Bin315]HOE88531.1 dihydrolipoyl dehydrogenase [Sphaerochaeta sp.]
MDTYDLLVIGGGPGGYACAIKAAKASMRVAIFEKESFGGTCLNVGCIPTKYLLDKASGLEKIRMLTEAGIYKDAGMFNFKEIQRQKTKVVEKLVGGVNGLLKHHNVAVFKGEAILKADKVVECNGKRYTANHIVIATGSRPAMISIPGVEHAITSTDLLAIPSIPKRLTVIGGGVIGLELSSAFNSFGSKVTVIEMMDSLLPKEQPQAGTQLKKTLEKNGLTFHLSARVNRIEKRDGVCRTIFTVGDKEGSIESELVLIAVGRKPNTDCITPDSKIVLTDSKQVKVDRYLQTSVDGVYAIGDVIGGYQLAHAAYAEAESVVDTILAKDTKAPYDDSVMPRCVYTIPAFAAVGKTTEQAGVETVVGTFSYEANGMALAEEAKGSVYVIMDKQHRITVGVQIVGEHAPELISLATAAVAKKFTFNDWKHLVIAHPSLSEMVKEAALDAFKSALHKV